MYYPLALLRLPSLATLRSLANWKLMLLGGAVVLIVSLAVGFAVATRVGAMMPSCPVSQSVLVYPRYSNKGLISDYTYRCGTPHRTCKARQGMEKAIYDCSPFVLPKGTVSWK